MATVDPKCMHAVPMRDSLPDEADRLLSVASRHVLSPKAVRLRGPLTGGLRYPPQLRLQRSGDSRGRLANIDLPRLIHRVVKVDSDAGELIVLLLLHSTQTEPVARHQQTPRPVDVESLMSVPDRKSVV